MLQDLTGFDRVLMLVIALCFALCRDFILSSEYKAGWLLKEFSWELQY